MLWAHKVGMPAALPISSIAAPVGPRRSKSRTAASIWAISDSAFTCSPAKSM